MFIAKRHPKHPQRNYQMCAGAVSSCGDQISYGSDERTAKQSTVKVKIEKAMYKTGSNA